MFFIFNMQVLSIQNNYNNKYSNPTFNSWIRRVEKVKENGTRVLTHCNTTGFFRADFGWKNGVDYLVEKYKNIPKVNVYNYGCSNGSEVYSLLMRLKSNYNNETFEKFTPVYAKDFDSVAISEANPEKGIKYRHAWNVVRVNGKYYHLDATFDNSLGKNTGVSSAGR